MKRWALLTVLLYGLVLVLLTVPVCIFSAVRWGAEAPEWGLAAWEVFQTGWYWVWLAVLMGIHALLLLVPVRAAEDRPRSRRSLTVPIVVATFLFTNLLVTGLFGLFAAVGGDQMFEHMAVPFEWGVELATSIGIPFTSGLVVTLNMIGLFAFFWLLWGLVFYHYAKADDAETLVRRVTHWLLRGSILELLVAVPSHIIVRSRNECCAPFATFWGIVTGLSIMLLSFGPGVLFLFTRRIRERRKVFSSNTPALGSETTHP